MSQQDIIQELVNQTLNELAQPSQPAQRSRVWKDPKGYEYLAIWQNAALLRVLVRKFTAILSVWERKLKAQLDDAARSQKRNLEEGWKRPTTAEYLRFIGYAQASLAEVKGDIRDAYADGFLPSKPGSSLKDIGIDLGMFKGPTKGQLKGEPTDPSHAYSKPLATLNPRTLTLEIFMELINKTDYLFRTLVASLEKKLYEDKRGYQIEQARIKQNIRGK